MPAEAVAGVFRRGRTRPSRPTQEGIRVNGLQLVIRKRPSPPRADTSAGPVICRDVRIAERFHRRLIGLLGKRGLEPGTGLLIYPCSSIHTFGMRFALDVVTMDRDYRVLGMWRDVRPWRALLFRSGTHRVLELASGSLPAELGVGDLLYIEQLRESDG
jgi:uncharacterized membrane protein (UPF0127 family)